MRLWSLHPQALDGVGIVACWREALLAQAVLAERTKGYRHHPQLERFRAQQSPLDAVGAYLVGLADEADARAYRFDRSRIDAPVANHAQIAVTQGQIDLEWAHLLAKVAVRSPGDHERLIGTTPRAHPLFTAIQGPVEPWERAILTSDTTLT